MHAYQMVAQYKILIRSLDFYKTIVTIASVTKNEYLWFPVLLPPLFLIWLIF